MYTVKDKLNCTMNYTNTQDHEPRAEINNRTIKNQIWVGLHRTTYKTILRVMIQHLAITSTDKFNNFPAKPRVSDYSSPETLLTGKTLDYKKDWLCEFGEHLQAEMYNELQNDMRARSYDTVYVRLNDNAQMGHVVMYLITGEKSHEVEWHMCHYRYS